jgi:hypothetical protein
MPTEQTAEHKGPPGGGTWVHDGLGGFTRPAGYAEGQGDTPAAEAPIVAPVVAPATAPEPLADHS